MLQMPSSSLPYSQLMPLAGGAVPSPHGIQQPNPLMMMAAPSLLPGVSAPRATIGATANASAQALAGSQLGLGTLPTQPMPTQLASTVPTTSRFGSSLMSGAGAGATANASAMAALATPSLPQTPVPTPTPAPVPTPAPTPQPAPAPVMPPITNTNINTTASADVNSTLLAFMPILQQLSLQQQQQQQMSNTSGGNDQMTNAVLMVLLMTQMLQEPPAPPKNNGMEQVLMAILMQALNNRQENTQTVNMPPMMPPMPEPMPPQPPMYGGPGPAPMPQHPPAPPSYPPYPPYPPYPDYPSAPPQNSHPPSPPAPPAPPKEPPPPPSHQPPPKPEKPGMSTFKIEGDPKITTLETEGRVTYDHKQVGGGQVVVDLRNDGGKYDISSLDKIVADMFRSGKYVNMGEVTFVLDGGHQVIFKPKEGKFYLNGKAVTPEELKRYGVTLTANGQNAWAMDFGNGVRTQLSRHQMQSDPKNWYTNMNGTMPTPRNYHDTTNTLAVRNPNASSSQRSGTSR